jgi:hypothetical protein
VTEYFFAASQKQKRHAINAAVMLRRCTNGDGTHVVEGTANTGHCAAGTLQP